MSIIDGLELDELYEKARKLNSIQGTSMQIIEQYTDQCVHLEIIANDERESEFVRHLAKTKRQTLQLFITELERFTK